MRLDRRQKVAMWVGIMLAIAVLLCPPRRSPFLGVHRPGVPPESCSAPWPSLWWSPFIVFQPQTYGHGNDAIEVDVPRLACVLLVIGLLTGGVIVSLARAQQDGA